MSREQGAGSRGAGSLLPRTTTQLYCGGHLRNRLLHHAPRTTHHFLTNNQLPITHYPLPTTNN
ncbi:hypothetical protein H6G17_07670 [Chroococcidiopsis sp. FACHB-1243]|uniref:hypothetical protein n=1 Tax=Chroococcidiopsis sp. [FACHB-1243] TaxID=2692781 RepID=UPI00178709C6|nr:hypothetical protein [Chroococcidiopsis sp. [FACHB-1243]]MBD2305390.1 hypothetical protein [Chroococcidiopsis sp. [FACHB-1243]]